MGKFLNQIRKKLGLDPQRDMTLTGKIPNEVVISRATQNESVDPTAPGNRPVVLAPARMNPPTVGHGVLMKQVYDTAQKYNAPHHVILTRTHDVPKKKTGADVKNPLTPEQKVMHAKRFFPGMNIHAASPDKPNLLSQASDLHRQGHNHLIVVAGSDRVPEYQKLLNTYNGQEGKHGYYNFKKITVVPAGAERDPNATGAAAVSGTSSRKAAESGDFDAWRKSTVPSHVTDTEAKQLFHHLRSGMGVKDTVSEASEGFPVQAIPTATARDRLGAKSPLNNLPPPGDAGDIGKDSNLKGKQKKNFQLMRRRDQKRSSAYLEGYDEVGGMDPINGGNRSAVFAPTTSPITTSRIAPKKIKEGLFAADIANGETGESGSANQSMEGIPVTAKEKTKSKEFKTIREGKQQSLGGALTNALMKPEPGSKLTHSIQKHNRAIKNGASLGDDHPALRTQAPDGHHFAKNGMIRLGEETELEEKRGLWDNIHAKQKRIKNGSGEHMRKPGSEGAPTAAALKASQNEEVDHKVGDKVSIVNPGHSSHKKSGKILKIVGNNARIKYGNEHFPEIPPWVMRTTFVPVSTLKKSQNEEVEIDEGAKVAKPRKDREGNDFTIGDHVTVAGTTGLSHPLINKGFFKVKAHHGRGSTLEPAGSNQKRVGPGLDYRISHDRLTKINIHDVPKFRYEKRHGHTVTKDGVIHHSFDTEHAAKKYITNNQGKTHAELDHDELGINEATYKGKTVPLNKPMAGDVKKSKVYVDPDGDGKAKKVNFGDKTLSIKKGIPARKKSYCARSGGQGNLTNKSSANYWSRKAWNCEQVELVEAHKIGTKVTIHKGQGAGITGRIGEIRRKFKGDTNPSYTIFHGENDAIRVNKSQIKAVNEQSLTDKVKAIMEGKK